MKRAHNIGRFLSNIENALRQLFEWLSNLHLISFITCRFNTLVRYINNDPTIVSPTPRELVKATLSAAKKHAVEWGADDLDFPNHFSIAINRPAWDNYYSLNVSYISDTIASELKAALSLQTGPKWNPIVEIVPDDYTDKCQITPTFVSTLEPVDKIKSVRNSDASLQQSADEAVVATNNEEASICPKTVVMNTERTAFSREYSKQEDNASDNAKACLSIGEQSYIVNDGDDFGLQRKGRPTPAIRLNNFANNPKYISTHQGVFALDQDGTWTLKNLGVNSLYIAFANAEQTDTRLGIKTGETANATNGMRIYLPESSQFITFKTGAEAKAVEGTKLQVKVAS